MKKGTFIFTYYKEEKRKSFIHSFIHSFILMLARKAV